MFDVINAPHNLSLIHNCNHRGIHTASGLCALKLNALNICLVILQKYSRYALSCDCGDVASDVGFEDGDVVVGLVVVVVVVCGVLVVLVCGDVSSLFTSVVSLAVLGEVVC